MNIRVKHNADKAEAELRGIDGRLGDLRPAFRNFEAHMLRRTALTFRRLGRGGTFRGVNWPPFAPQYRRKDGTLIPAWGGVPKVRGKGTVKGKGRGQRVGDLKPKRVTPSSRLLRSTGKLATAAMTRVHKTPTVLVMDTPVKYARRQHSMRPFQFFEDPHDVDALRRFLMRRLGGK